MGMIARVGRKRWTTRLLLASMLAALLLGSLTMLYPFGLMLAGSTKSSVDLREQSLLPSFIVSRDALWRKHVEGLFNESLSLMRCTYGEQAASFDRVPPPRKPNGFLAREWLHFLDSAQLPPSYYTVGYLEAATSKRVLPEALREFRSELSRRFEGSIDAMNRSMGTEFTDWSDLRLRLPLYFQRAQSVSKAPMNAALQEFMQRQPPARRIYFSIEGYYRDQYLRTQFGGITGYNQRHHTSHQAWNQVRLPCSAAECENDAAATTWETFVRHILHVQWIQLTANAQSAYTTFLTAKYGTIDALNRAYRSDYRSFAQIMVSGRAPVEGIQRSDWTEFLQGWRDPSSNIQHQAPTAAIRVESIEMHFRRFLRERFERIENLNAQAGTSFAAFDQVALPQEDIHILDFQTSSGGLRWELITRNYLTVLDYVVLHGRAIWNTVVYCALSILAALTVNPLAAYALSRYRPPNTYRLLLLMMLTMAFPPMVTQIPVFLMLRDFGLLNTYWALLLPGLANGYSIFLLKGFFDSLPRELYESATLDGAGEIRIFWQITMSLSKPILAVIALGAFTSAYTNFMFALLICQDERMWTLMVWLYQLQARAGQGVVLASVTLAAIPTLIVFVLCQRVIMRGIVVPVEK